ncbi:hypothetical protein BB561_003157 [Smittium simulii]|uniref:GDP/GTP exchange factor Sec2 N-terminal domain-containing protein n=1 Tax=Smittium simulii TaxID=133385 RepID=A0A2T9YML3_9FUNG|nr:hypothetical protein BB561_003157 [Smittium simulii]
MAQIPLASSPLPNYGTKENFEELELCLNSAASTLLSSQENLKLKLSSSYTDYKIPANPGSPKLSQNLDNHNSATDILDPSSSLSTNDKSSDDTLNDKDFTDVSSLCDKIELLEASLEAQLKKSASQNDQINDLRISLNAMNDKFVEQVNQTAEMAYSKELVESELEDLSRKLFEEANKMVFIEKKNSSQIQKKNSMLLRNIEDLRDLLENEKMQSSQLKQCLQSMSEESEINNVKHVSLRTISNSFNSSNESSSFITPFSLKSIFEIKNYTDTLYLNEFNEFIDISKQRNFSKLLSSSFMRYFMAEDIESCLRFGPKPRVSSKNIIDAITANSLQIEIAPPKNDPPINIENKNIAIRDSESSFTRTSISSFYKPTMTALGSRSALWERISGTIPPNPNGCQTCGKEGLCTYRFVLGLKPNEEWAYIDVACRDRLVAVCELYAFLRHLVNGRFSNRASSEILSDIMSLRLSLFFARFGLLSRAMDLDSALLSASLNAKNNFPESPQPFFLKSDSGFSPNSFNNDGNYSPTFSDNGDMNLSNPVISEVKNTSFAVSDNRNRSQSASITNIHSSQLSKKIPLVKAAPFSKNTSQNTTINSFLSSSLSTETSFSSLTINNDRPDKIITDASSLSSKQSIHVDNLAISDHLLESNKDNDNINHESKVSFDNGPDNHETPSPPTTAEIDSKLSEDRLPFPSITPEI